MATGMPPLPSTLAFLASPCLRVYLSRSSRPLISSHLPWPAHPVLHHIPLTHSLPLCVAPSPFLPRGEDYGPSGKSLINTRSFFFTLRLTVSLLPPSCSLCSLSCSPFLRSHMFHRFGGRLSAHRRAAALYYAPPEAPRHILSCTKLDGDDECKTLKHQ